MVDVTLNGNIQLQHLTRTDGLKEWYDATRSISRESPEPVTVKVLRLDDPSVASDQASNLGEVRFNDEIGRLMSLQHPGIDRIVGAGLHQARTGTRAVPWFAIEKPGGERVALICDGSGSGERPDARRRLVGDLERKIRLFRSLLEAVAHAHNQGILHLDLCPSNVWATNGETVHVSGFGLGAVRDILDPDRGHWVGTGTPGYQAPEQLHTRHGTIDTWTDVHALGVLGFQLLVGQWPYDVTLGTQDHHEAHRAAVCAEARKGLADWLKQQDSGTRSRLMAFAPVLDQACQKDPARRFADAGAMHREWCLVSQSGIPAARPVASPAPSVENRRHQDLPPPPSPSPDMLLASYREHVRNECDVVWGLLGRDSRRRLLAVHVPLHAVASAKDQPPQDAPKAGSHREPLASLAEKHRLLAILGSPGCGKSTFLRWMALKLASDPSPKATDPGLGKGLQGRLPVWLDLKRLPKEARPAGAAPRDGQDEVEDPDALPSLVRAWLQKLRADARLSEVLNRRFPGAAKDALEGLLRLLEDQVRGGNACFLLDGLDEVMAPDRSRAAQHHPRLRRDAIHDMISELAAWSPLGSPSVSPNRVLVTCRERSWFDGWSIPGWQTPGVPGSEVRTVDGLLATEMEVFLAGYLAPHGGAFPDATSLQEAKEVVDYLHAPARNKSDRLSAMASVPFNLRMIAWLVEEGRSQRPQPSRVAAAAAGEARVQLPGTRAAIYEQVLHQLLWKRDDTQGVNDENERTLGSLLPKEAPEHRRRFVRWLARLAHDGLRDGDYPSWKHSVLSQGLQRALQPEAPQDYEYAQPILRTLQVRSEVLRVEKEPGDDRGHAETEYGFVHRSFLEYFAALHLVDPGEQGHGNFLNRATAFLEARQRRPVPSKNPAADANSIRERTWEPLRLAAGYYAVEPAYQTGLLTEGIRDSSPVTTWVSTLRSSPDPYRVWLAGEVALEAGLGRDAHLDALRESLLGVMQSKEGLSEKERADVGRVLGQLGDRRQGVDPGMPRRGGKPFFKWSEEIPAGGFVMGGDPYALDHFKTGVDPVPRKIPAAYRIACYPVTNAQYDCFEKSSYFRQNASKQGWRKRDLSDVRFLSPNQPVVNVNWHHARAFCEWVNSLDLSAQELGLPDSCDGQRWSVRLPSESEWERAARWPDDRWLPWLPRTGKDKSAPKAEKQSLQGYCNWYGSSVSATSPVGMYPNGASQCDAEDMIGNVWEWTRTRWREVPDRWEDADIRDEDGSGARVLRGGSWVDVAPGGLRCAARVGYGPGSSSGIIGFRVVCVGVLASGG